MTERDQIEHRETPENMHVTDANRDTAVRPGHGSTTSTPRWVKVFMIIAIILVLLLVILHLTGNGFGAYMHMSSIEQGVPQL